MAQRFEGKTLDEALSQAAETLGVERYQLRHSTLLEKRGFLGGVKRVVIEAEVDTNASVPAAAPAVSAPSPVAESTPVSSEPAAPAAAPRSPRPEGRGGSGGGRGAARGGSRREGGGGGRGRGRGRSSSRDEGPAFQSGDFERFTPTETPEQGPQSEMAKVVRDWVEEVLDLVRIDVAVRTEENDTQIHVRLYGRDAGRMIDRHGELLDAVQVLANKALTGRKVEKEIELDCEAFKERRAETLTTQARELADRVRRDGREQLLPAMSPVERRIIHLALQDDAEVATESRGEGFFKRVAVIPRPASAPTES
ncbi:MAG: spoIIIJ-associated protein [Acidobacteriota bacterium]|jgi:spoIIIJ-associated protein|nr:spoIIIJ-associated protein [Acidobacteriota bacterium]